MRFLVNNMKWQKEKIFLVIAFVFGLLLSLLTVCLLLTGDKKTKISTPTSQISISLSGDAPFGLTISSSKDEIISGTSIRLTYDYKDKPRPDIQKPKLNDNLKALGWEYPVNQVNYDDMNRKVNIDISAINTIPEGYKLINQIMIASLNTSLPFVFDKNMTKLIDKQGYELSLDYLEK